MKSKDSSKPKKVRRKFTSEFKVEAVKLARSPGHSIGSVAKDIGVKEENLRLWVRQAEIDEGKNPHGALTSAERAELELLRREVKDLRTEKEILRKATVFFAKQQM
ncbi:MAG: hypothetical protein EOP10_12655 [Proteobacteria bacterium]|nr:MAG: hypothetical protein EOP10_12655 [Pseudomonadota bacterium]